MPASPTILFFAGAPVQNTLDWSEPTLQSHFITPVARFLHDGTDPTASSTSAPSSSNPTTKWRDVDLDPAKRVFTRSQLASQLNHDDEEDDRLDFLHHSLAILEDLHPTQIANVDDSTFISATSFTTTLTDTSLATENSDGVDPRPPDPALPQAPVSSSVGPISDLSRLPNASHLLSIHPQTMTVNVVVALISLSPSRTVQLRRSNATMDICELLVGDETRAGFSITCWLTTPDATKNTAPKDDLRSALYGLRPGDVILLQNIALTTFRGCVYGQTLSRRIARNDTRLTILPDDTSNLPVPLRRKSASVRQWRDNFLGGPKRLDGGSQLESTGRALAQNALPPDTQ